MDSININFHEICRACMKNADTLVSISLFKIINMLEECTAVEVNENDELPKHICTSCYIQLQNAFSFKKLYEESDIILRQTSHNKQLFDDTCETNEKSDSCKDEVNDPKNYNAVSFKKLYGESEIILRQTSQNKQLFEDDTCETNEKSDSSKDEINVTKNYVCELCNSKFDKVWYLGCHMRRAHFATGIKCSKCTLICYHQLHLKLHEESHSNVYKFTCDICKKPFKSEPSLRKHRVKEASYITTDSKYDCKLCDSKLKNVEALGSHMRQSHNAEGLKCSKCTLICYHQLHLKLHEESHSIYKFTCDICKKRFNIEADLKQHRVFHSNQFISVSYDDHFEVNEKKDSHKTDSRSDVIL